MKRILLASVCFLALAISGISASVTQTSRISPTVVELSFSDGTRLTMDFYGDNIVRLFQDNSGGIMRNPVADPPAEILVRNPRTTVSGLTVTEKDSAVLVCTGALSVCIDRASGLVKILRKGETVAEFTAPFELTAKKTTLTLTEAEDEYFYGGGVQNGRFSHKGKIIAIENQNSWTDAGVASPTPFFWSTKGYGMMFNTFNKGKYDFGATRKGVVTLSHQTSWLDVFIMVDDSPETLLADFYQLTGNPVLLPKFGFYEGHLNAYNRDYWKEDEAGILFEDGKRYKESQKDNGGIKESLNGEKDNYQFSARAVVDRYESHDMPLGWVLPNDGYGAGYGQTGTLDGNVRNLKEFGDYARGKGVEIGLWTQSDLHPKEGVEALLQRDIVKEIHDAGVRVLKTDVAWVGAGYSFGLNGISDVGELMPRYGDNARPFIITLDGWAGTQRYAGVWSGDQTGGDWEYIRFHIPTYIGSGLSGQPNITSDMDGIFGGKNPSINIRDFQWKTWTPMQLNMDGWGSNEKYPHALGEPAASINRMYLKLKSELLPYTYSIAYEAVTGKPMIRAMFLEDANPYTLGTATKYQYMFGPYFLVAPIYQPTSSDEEGNDIRNGIYLPEGLWADYFDGTVYEGGNVVNSYDAPLWKLPVFVKAGAIIPMNNANNNVSQIDRTLRTYEIYPYGSSQFTEYDDDGVTEAYKAGAYATTLIESHEAAGNAVFVVNPSEGSYEGMPEQKTTQFIINVSAKPKKVGAVVGKRSVKLRKAASLSEYESYDNAYFYDEAPQLNRFSTPDSEFSKQSIVKNPQLRVKVAGAKVAEDQVIVTVKGFNFDWNEHFCTSHGPLSAPQAGVKDEDIQAYVMTPSWEPVENADYYELLFQGQTYTKVRATSLRFEDLEVETPYSFQVRAVNADGCSDWSECGATTKRDPLEHAIKGMTGRGSLRAWEDFEESRLFDFAVGGDIWYTDQSKDGEPFSLVIDTRSISHLDKLVYLPRPSGGTGTLMKGSIATSIDKINWTEAGSFEWAADKEDKTFVFEDQREAQFIRLTVTESRRGNGSGREIFVFRVPGSEYVISGDINSDGKVDANDLTSYMNYTGLRAGDGDFDGYVSVGDINRNSLIDAYDISNVTTQIGLDEDEKLIGFSDTLGLAGRISVTADKKKYAAGSDVVLTVTGEGLSAVNALSFALPYDPTVLEYVGTEAAAVSGMENLTYDRLHTNGMKALYPTFVNIGKKELLNGSETLFTIRFKARKAFVCDLEAKDGILVDKELNSVVF